MSQIGSKLAASVRQAKDQINEAPEKEQAATPAAAPTAEKKAPKKKEVEKLVTLAPSRRVWPD